MANSREVLFEAIVAQLVLNENKKEFVIPEKLLIDINWNDIAVDTVYDFDLEAYRVRFIKLDVK